jgi:hypothetical protein
MSTVTDPLDSTQEPQDARVPAAHPLQDQVCGPVLRADDPGYATEVAGYNLALHHSPDVVVGATCTADVVAAVRYASEHGLPVGVQATGHGSTTLIDHGMLVTTSRMQDLVVDPVDRTVTVGAGVKWRRVLDEAAPHGLTGACGSTSDVGVVGFTVGGGLPLLGRAFGFGADRVRSMEVVTADGQLHHVDAEHDVDLFWALRGGKGNVGIVTSMTVELLPVTEIYGGGIFFDGVHAAAVLRAFQQVTAVAPEPTCLSVAFLRLPPLPDVPEPLRGRFVMHVRVAHLGARQECDELIAPIRAAAPPMMDLVGPMPITELDRVHMDPEHPVPAHERGALLTDLDDATVDALVELAGPDSSAPILLVEVRQLGGALSRPGPHPDAVGARGAAFSLFVVGVPAGPAAESVPGAVESLVGAMAPYCTGTSFANFFGLLRSEEDRPRCWPAATYTRLQQTKAARDPGDMFRFGYVGTTSG